MLTTCQEATKSANMVFGFCIAITCSCKLLVRLCYCGNAHDSQFDPRFDKTLLAVDSSDFPEFQQREISTPDKINTTFFGHASVGAIAASHIPPGGHITMVVMEDLDPISGNVLRATIAMVEVEDITTASDTNFNDGNQSVPNAVLRPIQEKHLQPASSTNWQGSALAKNIELSKHRLPMKHLFHDTSGHNTIKIAKNAESVEGIKIKRLLAPTTAQSAPTTSQQQFLPTQAPSRIAQDEHFSSNLESKSSVEVVNPQRKLTVRERINRFETITARNSQTDGKLSDGVMTKHVKGVYAVQTQKSSVSRGWGITKRGPGSTMTTDLNSAGVAAFIRRLRWRILLRRRQVQQRTNSSLENALGVLRRFDFNAMETASATIRKLTSDSRDCCARCIEVPVSLLIHNVFVRMSCQFSDPDLLLNLLLTLDNLVKYRRWKQQTRQPVTRFERFGARARLDSRLIELLGEVLLVLSDDLKPRQQQSWALFTAAAETLWELVMLVQDDAAHQSDESWIGTHQRLVGLRARLLARMKKLPQLPVTAGCASIKDSLLAQYLTRAAAILAHISSAMQT